MNLAKPGSLAFNVNAATGRPADHMASFKTGRPVPMKKLTDGTAEEMNSYCGSCHRTWDEIATGPKLGVANVRFQPYRPYEQQMLR